MGTTMDTRGRDGRGGRGDGAGEGAVGVAAVGDGADDRAARGLVGAEPPGEVAAGPDREVGAGRDDGADGAVGAGPEVGAGRRLPRLERWAEGRGVVTAMAIGLLVGASWGIVARAWMRLISEQPEFSWSGTLYIVGAPAVIGAVVALAHVAMARPWRAAMVVRVPAVVVHVLLGMGAGALLLPTIVFGSIALARRRFGLAMRIVLGLLVLAVGLPAGAGDGGSSAAVALMAAGAVVAVLLVSGWRTRAVLGTLAALAALGVSATVLDTDISLLRALPGALFYLPLVAIPTLTASSLLRPREAASVVEGGTSTGEVSGEVA